MIKLPFAGSLEGGRRLVGGGVWIGFMVLVLVRLIAGLFRMMHRN